MPITGDPGEADPSPTTGLREGSVGLPIVGEVGDDIIPVCGEGDATPASIGETRPDDTIEGDREGRCAVLRAGLLPGDALAPEVRGDAPLTGEGDRFATHAGSALRREETP